MTEVQKLVLAGISITPQSYRWRRSSIPLERLNVLPIQPRRTFDQADIVSLAITIAEEGLFNAPVVAFFAEEAAEDFLQEVSLYWGINTLSTNGLVKSTRSVQVNGHRTTKSGYYILLAGERRTRAVRWLFKQLGDGCALVGENPGEIEVHIPEGVSPEAAIKIQLEENTTQAPVPPHEQAAADFRLWTYMRRKNPALTRKEFARRTGRSESRVARAIRFHHLPMPVQLLVSEGRLIFGAALELERLQQRLAVGKAADPYTEDELVELAERMARLRLKVHECKEVVDREIEERANGQLSLEQMMFNEADRRQEKEEDWRRAEAARLSAALQSEIGYIQAVMLHRRMGEGPKDSALSLPSCCRNVHHLARQFDGFVQAVNQVVGLVTPEELMQLQLTLQLASELNETLRLAAGADDAQLTKALAETRLLVATQG